MISASATTTAPPEVVHDLVTDVEAWALWSPHLLRTSPSSGHVHPGWRGRVRPWFGPATTMEVLTVEPGRGITWRTRALGHELHYANAVRPGPGGPSGGSVVEFSATVHGPAAAVVERLVGRLSAFGQSRRIRRLVLLAERECRDRTP